MFFYLLFFFPRFFKGILVWEEKMGRWKTSKNTRPRQEKKHELFMMKFMRWTMMNGIFLVIVVSHEHF